MNATVPKHARIQVPAKPRSTKLMRLFMMLRMIIVIGFVVALFTAGTAASV